VVAAVEAMRGRAVLRTRVEEETGEGAVAPVLVIDSTGELRDWQALATVVVMGKSFLSRGGQNPAEAIAAGVPVICGPHMENFTPLMQLLLGAGGITQVEGMGLLGGAVEEVLRAPEKARAVAERGRLALEQHRGATRRSVAAIGAVGGECGCGRNVFDGIRPCDSGSRYQWPCLTWTVRVCSRRWAIEPMAVVGHEDDAITATSKDGHVS
jgi:hypothetical protein